MGTRIYYFSGTGNSLHIAREVASLIPEVKLLPIVSLLKKEWIEINEDKVGIICPVYVNSIPIQVQRFLKKIEIRKVEYLFCMVTHGGFANVKIPRRVLQRILKKKGRELDAYFALKMTNNSATGIMPTFIPGVKSWADWIKIEKVEEREKHAMKELKGMVDIIEKGRKNIPTGRDGLGTVLFDRFINTFPESPNRRISFFTDETCTGCGTCERVCLSGTVKMVEGKPTWRKDVNCFHCYASFNFCPEQAILVKNYKFKDGRYHHPDITADDIASQK
jgi:ferredoxin